MKLNDIIITLIMFLALLGMAVFLFNIPIGIDTRTFGAWTFGAILVFGIINIAMVVIDSIKRK
ncbi:hypothetical protein [Roseibium alexandrii]|uniref:Uncharacterized protein n=1 Tax=Roseibium alexandrii TaxID=388408 RepID=A0A0M7ANC9_9HYPH|nr:hypothetical protein [Roseibium alexandrii]CTQ76648.1 hypothetical protein LAX5112_04659 [Roseibium alexandrii]